MFMPYNFDARQQNALKNVGGNVNDPMYKKWLATYGPGGTNNAPNAGLAADVNQFMTNQAVMPFTTNLPGYANMVGQRSENALSMLKGQIPDDVITQISQGAAERGIMGGMPSSPNSNAAYLRALGLTSIDMMGEGSKQLSQSIADTPVPELWNPMSLYVPQTLAAQNMQYAKQGMQDAQKTLSPKLEYSYSETRPGLTPTYKYKYFA